VALYFAFGLSVFAGSEPGWLSSKLKLCFELKWIGRFSQNHSKENLIHKFRVTQSPRQHLDQQVKQLIFFYVNTSYINGIKSWQVMIFAFFKTNLL